MMDGGDAVYTSGGGRVGIPDRPPLGGAEGKSSSNTNRTERVQAVGICKDPVLQRRIDRVTAIRGLPVMVFDAGDNERRLGRGKGYSLEHLLGDAGSPCRVIGSTAGMADVVEQRSGLDNVDVCRKEHRELHSEIADPQRVMNVMARSLARKRGSRFRDENVRPGAIVFHRSCPRESAIAVGVG